MCCHRISAYPRWGPPFMRSKTWAGFSSCLNLRRNFTPWLSPLFELTKTNKGLVQEGGQVAFQKPVGEKRREKGKSQEMWSCPWRQSEKKTQHPTPQHSYEETYNFLVLMALIRWTPNVHSPESSMNHNSRCQTSHLSPNSTPKLSFLNLPKLLLQ